MTATSAADAGAEGGRWRARAWLAVRVSVTVAALWWTLSRVSPGEMMGAAGRVTAGAAMLAVALTFGNLLVGALRWRVLMHAYGARRPPRVGFLARAYLVGIFYNTFVPGNVGGDVLRGHVTRRAFAGAAGAYVTVAIERVFGLAGLLLLAAGVLLVHPIGGIAGLSRLALAGIAAALAAASAPVVARRLAPRLPGRLGRLAAGLPALHRPLALAAVLALSVGTQGVVAVTGHVLVSAIDSSVSLLDSLVLVPVAMAAVYFPAAVAGLGVREAAFVALFTQVGVGRADATAASLAFLGAQLTVAAVGGILHVFRPLRPEADTMDTP